MRQRFEAYSASDGIIFASVESIEDQRAKGLLEREAQLLYVLEADTWEEALSIHNLRMGWGPYNPMSDPEPCPKCGAWFYPKGSGQCWRCGDIC